MSKHAGQLLKEGAKVDEVAKACGLKSTNQLRTVLKAVKKNIIN